MISSVTGMGILQTDESINGMRADRWQVYLRVSSRSIPYLYPRECGIRSLVRWLGLTWHLSTATMSSHYGVHSGTLGRDLRPALADQIPLVVT
jgi:hypothetical protein